MFNQKIISELNKENYELNKELKEYKNKERFEKQKTCKHYWIMGDWSSLENPFWVCRNCGVPHSEYLMNK